jgi:hypothetical protein
MDVMADAKVVNMAKNMNMVVQVYKLEVLTQMLIIAVQEVATVLNMIQM